MKDYCFSLTGSKIDYDLFAVCCHWGNPDFGHYYCYTTSDFKTWFLNNDDVYYQVESTQLESI